jgi:tetratricopeptide (TPR) repeat protein
LGAQQNQVNDAAYGGTDYNYNPLGQLPTQATTQSGMPTLSERDLARCAMRANLSGYTSTEVSLGGFRLSENPDIGTLVLRKSENVGDLTISTTTLKAPKKAQNAFDNGVKQAQQKKWDKAESELLKAVKEYPEYAVAWETLGAVYEAQRKLPEARDAYTKSIAADEKLVSPYLGVARVDMINQKWPDVIASADRAIGVNPNGVPAAYYYIAVANFSLRNADGAEKAALQGIKINADTQYPDIRNILGLVLAQKGDYQGAQENLKKYLELAPDADNAEVVRQQLAQIEQALAKK